MTAYPRYSSGREHRANQGLDFSFDQNGIREEVLRNYLSRAQNCNVFQNDFAYAEEDLAMLYATGAKMVSRADTPWWMGGFEYEKYPRIREYLRRAHEYDPDLLFENCIFECVYPEVGEISVPPETFRAFGLPVEDRCFSYEAMLFPDGRFVNQWDGRGSVPDLTRLETQLWIYYRACLYIDLGFESIHFGQIMLMGKSDVGFVLFDRLIRMIREYARDHARRGWVLVNAHMYDDRVAGTDRLICDFHMTPTRGMPPVGAVRHPPYDDAPQEIELCVGHFDSVYLESVGGLTPSGWRTSSLPYLVELDNVGSYDKEWLDTPYRPKQTEWFKSGWWGFDEISWFANQPDWYRRKWLRHAWHWIRHIGGHGYCQMPGHRQATLRSREDFSEIFLSQYLAHQVGDVETIRDIWLSDRRGE